MNLQQETSPFTLEWSVRCPGGPAGIGKGLAGGIDDDEVAAYEEDLLRIIVNKRHRRIGTGIESKKTRSATDFFLFIQVTGQYLLLDSFRIPGRGRPALVHVYLYKF